MNHLELRDAFNAQLLRCDASQNRIASARVVAYDNQQIQLELDRIQQKLDETRETLETQMLAIALSN